MLVAVYFFLCQVNKIDLNIKVCKYIKNNYIKCIEYISIRCIFTPAIKRNTKKQKL